MSSHYINIPSQYRSFSFVDQANETTPTLALLAHGAVPSGAIKYETTVTYVSIVDGQTYALGIGFIGSPTLTIWNINDPISPILVGTYSYAAGGAYNASVGVVNGVQYAFVGYNSGSKVDIIKLTNPAAPVSVRQFVISGSPGSIYGVSFLNGYLYCGTQSAGLVVLDVGGGTGSPSSPIQTYTQGSPYKSFGVVAVGSNVYTTYYSTASPFTIRNIISWTTGGPSGSPSVPALLQSLQVTTAGEALGLGVYGNTAFVTTATTGAYNINLVDVTNPSAMTNLSHINSTNAFGSAFYAVATGTILYVPSGGNATYGGAIDAYSIINRSTPVHLAQAKTGVASSAFGGIALANGYIYCADYGLSTGTAGTFDVFNQI